MPDELKPEELELSADHPAQMNLLDVDPEWRKQWGGMPEFVQKDQEAFKQLVVNFENESDYRAFGKLIKQPLTPDTRSIWYPSAEIGKFENKRYAYAPDAE